MNHDMPLVDMINERLKSNEVELPVFDLVAKRVFDEVQKDEFDGGKLAQLLEKDPALTGEVLRVANSSFYRGLEEVTELDQAIVRIGAKHIASLAVATSQKRIYSASSKRYRLRLLRLWRHVSAAALGCRSVARKAGYLDLADQAFVAGLLHDVGKVSLLRIIEEMEQEHSDMTFSDPMIDMSLQALYCEHGRELLKLWNLPDVFVTMMDGLEGETFDEGNVTLAIVRLVNNACAREGISDFPDESICLETSREAALLGMNEIQLAELLIELEDASTTL